LGLTTPQVNLIDATTGSTAAKPPAKPTLYGDGLWKGSNWHAQVSVNTRFRRSNLRIEALWKTSGSFSGCDVYCMRFRVLMAVKKIRKSLFYGF